MRETNPIEIINALKRGNKLALAKLYDMYGPIIYGVALEMLKDEGMAQEVLQDTFIKVWQRIAQYDETKSRFFSWVYKIGRNTAIDKIRSSKHFVQLTSSEQDEHYVVESNYHNKMDTETMLGDLDVEFEDVLRLSYIHGHSQSEISEKLNLPLGTVKSRIRLGLQKLRKIYTRPSMARTSMIIFLITSIYG